MIKLGVARLPEIEKDNTDRNRTSPFAFTGNKFEFRAVGSSQSIAFPIVLLNAAVAEAIGEITAALRGRAEEDEEGGRRGAQGRASESSRRRRAIRFEGNNYSDEWVKEAAKRGLPNLRRTPEALAQMHDEAVAQAAHVARHPQRRRSCESRYHVRLERYIKDMLIEMHTLREMVDTMVLPAAFEYSGALAKSRRRRRRRASSRFRRSRRRTTIGAHDRGAAEASRGARAR